MELKSDDLNGTNPVKDEMVIVSRNESQMSSAGTEQFNRSTVISNDYYSLIAATPGSTFPSIYSRSAPPPVLT